MIEYSLGITTELELDALLTEIDEDGNICEKLGSTDDYHQLFEDVLNCELNERETQELLEVFIFKTIQITILTGEILLPTSKQIATGEISPRFKQTLQTIFKEYQTRI